MDLDALELEQPDKNGQSVTVGASERLQHVKTRYICVTEDNWKLHVIRTVQPSKLGSRVHPVILCPGLGSSGAYSFDLSPSVSLADYLAARGWDVWTVELRGNGRSEKPKLMGRKGRWWTIDDNITKDVPALVSFVRLHTGCAQLHFVGHSMGGMILTGVMARNGPTAARVRSCTLLGSGCFLRGSRWQLLLPLIGLTHLMYTVPSGLLLRWYSRLCLTRCALPAVDQLYVWPSNTDPQLLRDMFARNFSNISVGVIQQMGRAFDSRGLKSLADGAPYADPERLRHVQQPLLAMVGDKDLMCPPQGCRQTFEAYGSPVKQFVLLGPAGGQRDHYGHFDILMGLRAEAEVFPRLNSFLQEHDAPCSRL